MRSRREISKLIHRHPDQGCLWITLSTVLIRSGEGKKPDAIKLFPAAAKCALIAMKLGQTHMDVTKVIINNI